MSRNVTLSDGPYEGRIPYKVVTHDRRVRKGVVASTLEELIRKGCEVLNLPESRDARLLLENDGTEICDEEYFKFLDPQTSFVLLTKDQEYSVENLASEPCDEPDSLRGDLVGDTKVREILSTLGKDITNMVALSPDDMNVLLKVDDAVLSRYLDPQYGAFTSRKVKEACQRFIDEQQQAREYMSFVDLLRQTHDSGTTEDSVSDSETGITQDAKRRRSDDQS